MQTRAQQAGIQLDRRSSDAPPFVVQATAAGEHAGGGLPPSLPPSLTATLGPLLLHGRLGGAWGGARSSPARASSLAKAAAAAGCKVDELEPTLTMVYELEQDEVERQWQQQQRQRQALWKRWWCGGRTEYPANKRHCVRGGDDHDESDE